MKLLLSADLHLGRSSSGIPLAGDARGIALSTREAWKRIVELAVREECDAVLLAGDLVESASAFYEALGPLVEGFRALQERGISLCAVAGNHDAGAFGKIANEVAEMEGVHFLGVGGKWERVELRSRAGETLSVDGWSFPAPFHVADPLDDYQLAPPASGALLGLVHVDLEVSASRYAPTTSAALRARPPRFWLLGHVHKPGFFSGGTGAGLLYPGSPQALDFGETGPHGVWMLETAGERWVPQFRQISSVRYEDSLRVELTGTLGDEEIEGLLLRAAREQLGALPPSETESLRCLVHRCAFVGEFDRPQVLADLARRLPELAVPEEHGVRIFFQSGARDETVLPLDLEALRERGGALGELAARYGQLTGDAWREADWFQEIHREVVKAFEECRLAGDGEASEQHAQPGLSAPPGEEQTRAWLLAKTKLLLQKAREKMA